MTSQPPMLDVPPIGSDFLREITSRAAETPSLEPITRLSAFHGFMGVFVAAFLVSLLVTPLMRRLALANGVVDHPSDARKLHRAPVAYLGGVAVFIGLLAGVVSSFILPLPLASRHEILQQPMPLSILLGMFLIMFAGLLDDVVGISPRIKVAMQLVAAAALAMNNVGVNVAAGLMKPLGALIGNQDLIFTFSIPISLPVFGSEIRLDLIYWTGTAIIAIFILGACNASNLIDGLDGLCTGVTSIAAAGLLLIALGMAVHNDGTLDSTRLVLCMSLLGATLGFLPHNFNPANIFLGDCGSMLLGYLAIVIILTLGDTGKTPLVVAGLLVYSVPIIDTTLAIVRRRLARRPMSEPDDQHLHHMLLRAMGVKRAVFSLYGVAFVFGTLGVLVTLGRARVAYLIALILASYIGVIAVKMGRRKQLEEQAVRTLASSRRLSASANMPTQELAPQPVRSAEHEEPHPV